jgi:cytochrome P450
VVGYFVAPIGNDRLSEEDILEITRSSVDFTRYFLELLEERRRKPRDDFLTLLNGTDDPEEDITEASRLSYIAQLLGAGNETSTKMIAAGAAILARDHALAAELRAGPEHIPAFVEEVLRLSTPVQGLYRTARGDTELAGIPIPAGSHVVVWYAGGNRHPDVSRSRTTSTSTATTSADTSLSAADGTTASARRSAAPRV